MLMLKAPVLIFQFKLDFLNIHIDEHWTLDMEDFDSVVQILRTLEVAGFIRLLYHCHSEFD